MIIHVFVEKKNPSTALAGTLRQLGQDIEAEDAPEAVRLLMRKRAFPPGSIYMLSDTTPDEVNVLVP